MTALSALLNFTGRARLPVVLQNEVSECGLACLAMMAVEERPLRGRDQR